MIYGWFMDDLWMEILENPLEKRKKWPSSRPWLLVAFLWRGDLLMGGSGWQTEEGGRLSRNERLGCEKGQITMNSMNIDSRSWQIGRRWVFTNIRILLYQFIIVDLFLERLSRFRVYVNFGEVFGSPNTIIEGVYIGFKKHPQIQSQKVFGAGGMCDPQG